MDYLDPQQIKSLLERVAPPAVSIYFPTRRGAADARQDRIRLKNAMIEARRQMAARGLSDRDADALLAPCRTLTDDGNFWTTMADGLAIFLDRQGMHSYRLPFPLDPVVMVAETFFIKPLIPFLNQLADFYVLALSEQQVRLFRGNPYGLREVEINGVPRNMEDFFQYDQPEAQHQWHTRTQQPAAAKAVLRQAIFHGHGGATDTNKVDRERFIQVVDRRLNRVLTDKSIPLVLAAVDHSLATYQAVSSYPRLAERHVQGNPDHWDEQELWRRAWPVVEPELLQRRDQALKRCLEAAHSEMGGRSFEKVTPRAYQGRVDELIVAADRAQYGTFDPATSRIVLHDEPQSDSIELLEFTARHAILNGGSVYAMKAREVPGYAWLLATFRY